RRGLLCSQISRIDKGIKKFERYITVNYSGFALSAFSSAVHTYLRQRIPWQPDTTQCMRGPCPELLFFRTLCISCQAHLSIFRFFGYRGRKVILPDTDSLFPYFPGSSLS